MNSGSKAWTSAASLAGVFATMVMTACGGEEAKSGSDGVDDATDADTTFVPVEDTVDRPSASELLSAELDQLGRDRVYEASARAAVLPARR